MTFWISELHSIQTTAVIINLILVKGTVFVSNLVKSFVSCAGADPYDQF